jgi:hypothetical protein
MDQGSERKFREREAAKLLCGMLQAQKKLSTFEIKTAAKLLYRVEVNGRGLLSPANADGRPRGQSFEVDLLISSQRPDIPLVAIELKYGSFSTHDVITYSAKAGRHKIVYPYLRYGFVLIGAPVLGSRFLGHNENFDFAIAVQNPEKDLDELSAMLARQIESAQQWASLTEHSGGAVVRYERVATVRLPERKSS